MTEYINFRLSDLFLRTVLKTNDLKFKVKFLLKRARQIFVALIISVNLNFSNHCIIMFRCIPLPLTDN